MRVHFRLAYTHTGIKKEMRIENLHMTVLEIPLKTSFKHASAERSKTASVWVEARSENPASIGHGEGCPRAYVTGESLETALAWFNRHHASLVNDIHDMESLHQWVNMHGLEIDLNPAAWCAIELALLDLLGRSSGHSLEALLGLPLLASTFQYSAVLGDSPLPAFERQALQYLQSGFRDFKIKLSGKIDTDIGKISCLNNFGLPLRLRADANNLWQSPLEVTNYLRSLGQPFWAIEEPLSSRDFAGLAQTASALGIKIILDESFTKAQDFDAISNRPELWILNLRISKLGGLVRSLKLLAQARNYGFKIIIGAHVGETSLLSRAALTLAAAADNTQVAMEGAFGTHLLEYDVCEPPLMFGPQGVLRAEAFTSLNASGNGLQIDLT